jgi:hypothetical protein
VSSVAVYTIDSRELPANHLIFTYQEDIVGLKKRSIESFTPYRTSCFNVQILGPVCLVLEKLRSVVVNSQTGYSPGLANLLQDSPMKESW